MTIAARAEQGRSLMKETVLALFLMVAALATMMILVQHEVKYRSQSSPTHTTLGTYQCSFANSLLSGIAP